MDALPITATMNFLQIGQRSQPPQIPSGNAQERACKQGKDSVCSQKMCYKNGGLLGR